jgi:hypothetical protein
MQNNMLIPLHPYQVFAKEFAKSHPYCGLFLTMGLGKTSIILETLYEINPHTHVLIIAPKNIAKITWQNEIKKWNMPFRTKSLVVDDNGKDLSKKKREKIYDSIKNNKNGTVYFINRELIPDLVKRFPDKAWPFGVVIIDESQSFKSHSSVRFKALTTVRDYMQRVILLTGSPAPKGVMDLWAQIYLLDKGLRLGKNITAYRNNYFDEGLKVNSYAVSYNPKPIIIHPQSGKPVLDQNGNIMSAEDLIYNRISDIVISMKNTNLQLPALTFNDIVIDMNDDEKKLYKSFMKTYILKLEDGTEIEAVNAAVLQSKLSQIASGAIYTNTSTHEFSVIHKHKLEMCEYIINNTDSPVIISYFFKSDLIMLQEYFKEVKIDARVFDNTPQMEEEWNAKKIPVMLIQPASCGFGLNFQKGGHTLIWYTIPWSLEQYEQTNARIYRQGQTEPVIIHHLLMRNTIDKKILDAIHKKDLSQKALLDAIEASII